MAAGIINRVVPSSAFALGVARVVVHGTFLVSVLIASFSALGHLPVTIMRPTGVMKYLPWSFYDRLITPSGMTILKVLLVLSLLLGAAGLFTVVSTKTSFLLVLFYQGLLRSFGHFNHDEMLGVYCLAVLAFTPCGDEFSLDQWWRKTKRVVQPAFAYAYPILLMQLLMAWVYFSSCLIKLRAGWLNYISPDNLPSLAIYHSLDNLHDTAFRLAFWLPQFKAYLPVLVALVLFWEFFFPLAVFFPRLRWYILGGGVVFHLSTLFLMNIFFPHQLALYLLFVNWDRFRKSD
ncbi:MAG TPA: HTTM domain-containing protein [Pyrinomonadaceae bacterium]|nr:HTTM domain-containing protein [Pyrinomonadaceae bacterium]